MFTWSVENTIIFNVLKTMGLSVTEIKNTWAKILEVFKARLNDENTFSMFFADSYVSDIVNNTIKIVLNSSLAVTLCQNKAQVYENLKEAVLEVMETDFNLEFYTSDDNLKNKNVSNKKEEIFKSSYLNSNLNFDNFVIGTFNRGAAQAALMTATTPGKMFNPLFIYSDSGLGKTHLLHAIGNCVKKSNPGAKVICITSDDFFNEYVKSLSQGKDTNQLRDYCKTIDVFLIDDIQFLAEKNKTQDLFYFVFNDLIKESKQIVITSDREPNELKGVADRLVSRFSNGLTVKISDPDVDTCVEILKKKIHANSDLKELVFDDDALSLLADKFSKNIRELEGALNKVIFQAILRHVNRIDLKLTAEAISTISGGKYIQDELNEKKIINIVADYYNLTPSVLTGKSRHRQVSIARHMAMYLIRDVLDYPLKKIGDAFGGKDHTTVMNAITNVNKILKNDPSTQSAIKELKNRIENR